MGRRLTWWLIAVLAVAPALPGCGDDGDKQKSTTGNGHKTAGDGNGDSAIEPGPTVPAGVDAKDSSDPALVGKFPRSGQLGQWIKVSPVTRFDAADMGKLVDAPAFYEPYGVDWAARSAYQLGADKQAKLFVKLFHCRDSGDAYGLMSIMSDESSERQFGQESRKGVGEQAQLHIWSGDYYLQLYSEGSQTTSFVRAMERMADAIVTNLPGGGGKPSLVYKLGTMQPLGGRIHYVRGPRAIASVGLGNLVHQQAFAKTLALESDDELVVAAYPTDMPTPSFQFVVKYGTAARAAAAYGRCQNVEAGSALEKGLMVGNLRGQYFYGTLTPEEYSRYEAKALTTATPEAYAIFAGIDHRCNQ